MTTPKPHAALVLLLAGSAAAFAASQPQPAAPPTKPAEAAQPADDGFRRTFDIDKSKLGPTGGNTFFTLTPGTVLTFQDGKVKLTITALPETRVVDGVTTRVIEEREEKDGALIEISRNFFAADKATGDVYYFGEEVDIYKDGKISSHEGAWLSGANGATFGLMIPAQPKKGERYYQEVAPGVALDRAEVTATDATVKTPAGEFKNCLHITETTPLEKGTGHKFYAPGVGLIKDDDCALVSHTPAKP